MVNRWFLMLPDIFHFITIFGLGLMTGILLTIILILLYCWGGGEIQIKYTNKDQENF